ncbi:MAG: CpsB/CapC family capsule biosynthesis tyrosine phosphatase [Bacteroidota bacterium]
MFSFFKKKPSRLPIDLSRLGVDMHSHLIPGIDDGAKTIDESIAMLYKFQELGYRRVITTPHTMSDYYKNTPEIILSGLENVRAEARKIGLTIEIEAASEYYFDDLFMKKIGTEEILTFGGNHVLVEFAMRGVPLYENDMFFALIKNNYQPVLAHFERYMGFFGSVDKAKEYKDRGILIQMNLLSLTGHYGPEVKKQAERLVDAKLVDFAATDCHRIDHLMLLEKHLSDEYFHKLLELELRNGEL